MIAQLNFNIVLICILLATTGAINSEVNNDIKSYLLDSHDFVSDQLKTHAVSTRGIGHTVEFHGEQTFALPGEYDHGHAITMLNKNYLLLDYKLYHVVPGSNELVHVQQAKFLKYSGKIAFVKSVEYNLWGLLVIGMESGAVSVYGYNDNSTRLFYMHSLDIPYKLTDAKFFFNENNLYLIMSSSAGSSKAPVITYKWANTHLDQVHELFTEGSIALSTFPSAHAEIIVILRNNSIDKSRPFVYEFISEQMRKIQILENIKPKHIVTFIHGKDIYTLTFGVGRSILYLWNGIEFLQLQNFEDPFDVELAITDYVNQTPLVFISYKHKLDVYTLGMRKLKLMSSYDYQVNYTNILDMQVKSHKSEHQIFIIGLNESTKVTYAAIAYKFNELPTVARAAERSKLTECVQELEDSIKADESVLEFGEERRGSILKKSDSLILGKINETSPILTQVSHMNFDVPHNKFQDKLQSMIGQITDLETHMTNLQPQVAQLLDNAITMVYGKLIIQGSLNSHKLTPSRVFVKKLNGVRWTPEQWLSYSKEQVIPSTVNVNNMIVNILKIPASNKYFIDLLLLNDEHQIIKSSVIIHSLKAASVFSAEINNIAIEKMYMRNGHIKIRGNKTFDNIKVDNLQMELLNRQNAANTITLFGDSQAVTFDFMPSMKVTNLEVESINNVNWNEFTSSIFRVGSDQPINGNIRISSAKTKDLHTKTLSGIEVGKLLTSSTHQTVDSELIFGNLDTSNVVSEKINGLDFANDVAWLGADVGVHIKGPVTIKHVDIHGNLSLNESMGKVHKENRIVGTNEADLFQIYNKRVKITGNLHLQNLYLPGSSKLFVSGNEFNQDNFDEYWLKTTHQEIPTHFEALMGITTPHLSTTHLNNVPVDDYMVNDLSDKLPSSFAFENATVLGNIFINEELIHTPDLKRIDQEAVKLHGTVNIRGVKKFTGNLSVDHMRADFINSLPTSNFQTIYSDDITGNNIFDRIIVEGDVEAGSITTKTVNGVDLENLSNRAMYIDAPVNLKQADFVNVTVKYLTTRKMNNKLLSDYVQSLDQLYSMTTLNLASIKGSARVNDLVQVNHINDINVSQKITKGNGVNNVITGEVRFEGKVHVNNLFIANMNGIDFRQLLPRLFYRDWMQYISSRHVFKVLTTRNLITPVINGINMDNLLDTKTTEPQRFAAELGLQLGEALFSKSLITDSLQCDVDLAASSISNAPRRAWKSVEVVGNATILDDESVLGQLIKYSVRKDTANIIKAHVTLNNLHAEAILTKKDINGVSLQEIVNDALMLTATKQLVTGYKVFGSVFATNAEVYGNAQMPFVNKLDILKLNSSIIHRSDINNVVVKGRKTFFAGVETTHTIVSTIFGIEPENLVSLGNPQTIPNAAFDTLVIPGDLDIDFVNNQNFTQFMGDRLLLSSDQDQIVSAVCFFEELELKGPSTTPNINSIPLDDVVFDEGIQTVLGFKSMESVDVVGDVLIENINGFSINNLYERAILQGADVNIEGNMRLNDVSNISANIITQTINEIPVNLLKDQLNTQNPQIRANIVQETITNIETLIEESVVIIQRLPDQYLYLEKSDKLQVEIPNSVNAQVVGMKENIMIHVQTEEPGDHCGLHSSCVCPNQHSVVITSQYSINTIENKYGQRVFSYQDEEITIHIVTNSWSSSTDCRTNSSMLHEYTTLRWTIAQLATNTTENVYPEPITGYISDVKFFTIGGQVYAILSRFYDAILDTHILECLVLKFSKEEGKIEHIQKIKTMSAWTMHVFYTAQGLNLIIGSKIDRGDPKVEITTNIYRFDMQSHKFQLIRAVPSTGCLVATSIVLGYDSLVVLANSKSPMQILKYNRFHDNYHFYHNFIFEHPVIGVSVFYTGGSSISDAYLIVVTDNNQFLVYSYQYLSGFALESEGLIDGLKGFVPFTFLKTPYLFAPSTNGSSVLTIVRHGSN